MSLSHAVLAQSDGRPQHHSRSGQRCLLVAGTATFQRAMGRGRPTQLVLDNPTRARNKMPLTSSAISAFQRATYG